MIFTALTPSGTWWASSFAAATFAMQLEASQTLLGVFQVGDEALLLIGVVSPTSTAPLTEITYATPIPTLQFPLTVGATWSATSNVTGTCRRHRQPEPVHRDVRHDRGRRRGDEDSVRDLSRCSA